MNTLFNINVILKYNICFRDALSHFVINHYSENHKLELMHSLTDLLGKTFPVQFVFPALGHDDLKEHSRMWSRWLPPDSIKTFQTGK